MVIDQPNTILEVIVKENRKLLQDRLKNYLTMADYLFERGYFSRADYHEIDDVENATQRCNKFLDILVSKRDSTLLDVFIDHLAELESKNNDNNAISLKLLHEKLTLSRDKYSPKDVKHTESTTNSSANDNASIIDYADFTLTQKCLEEICKAKILRNGKAKAEWRNVISNMNGLEDVELLVYEDPLDISEYKQNMRLRFKGEHQTIQNYIHCTNWEEIAQKCFALWKEINGTNATFYSLVGIFQHSQLIGIADWLLNNKDDIQKGNFKSI